MPVPSPLADVPEQWPVVSSTDLHRDGWVVALRADRIRRPGREGSEGGELEGGEEPFRRLVLEHPGAVIVLALDEHDRALCLWQYRHPAGRRFVELPAGLCDEPGEEPLQVAIRELREEALLEATDWTHLTTSYSSPGISSEVMHLFLARGLRAVERGAFEPRHEEADMETLWVPFAELYDGVLDGRLTDLPLVTTVLLARARGLVAAER